MSSAIGSAVYLAADRAEWWGGPQCGGAESKPGIEQSRGGSITST